MTTNETIRALLGMMVLESPENRALRSAIQAVTYMEEMENPHDAPLVVPDPLAPVLAPTPMPTPVPTAEPIPYDVTPPKKQPKRKPFDVGKAVACYKAGRPVAWIADEMGYTEQTIRNQLRKAGVMK